MTVVRPIRDQIDRTYRKWSAAQDVPCQGLEETIAVALVGFDSHPMFIRSGRLPSVTVTSAGIDRDKTPEHVFWKLMEARVDDAEKVLDNVVRPYYKAIERHKRRRKGRGARHDRIR